MVFSPDSSHLVCFNILPGKSLPEKTQTAKQTHHYCCHKHSTHGGTSYASTEGTKEAPLGYSHPGWALLRWGCGCKWWQCSPSHVDLLRVPCCSVCSCRFRGCCLAMATVLQMQPKLQEEILSQRKAMLKDSFSVEAGFHPQLLSFQICNVILHRLVLNCSVMARFQSWDVQFSSVKRKRSFRIICDEKLWIFCYCSVHACLDIFTLAKWILYSHITEGFYC